MPLGGLAGRLATVGLAMFSLVHASGASASVTFGAPYQSAAKSATYTPDSTGNGTASASATALTTGDLSANTSATSGRSPGMVVDSGYGQSLGANGSKAFSYGEIDQSAGLTSGSHSVSVSFTGLNVAFSPAAPTYTNSPLPGYPSAGASAYAQADLVVEFYACQPASPGCAYTSVDRTVVPLNNGTGGALTITSASAVATYVVIRAGLVSRSTSWGGQAGARSSVAGVLSSITIT